MSTLTQAQQKQLVAKAAKHMEETKNSDGFIVGVGTGSTANCFIDELPALKDKIKATVASSEASAARLKERGLEVVDMNTVSSIGLYFDGADETNDRLELIKGGGGALTREKIVAGASTTFVCMCDGSKYKEVLGKYPLPVEEKYVAAEITKLGGRPVKRDFITDNGNVILDVHDFMIPKPVEVEEALNHIPGVVTVGLFARRGADVLLIPNQKGEIMTFHKGEPIEL